MTALRWLLTALFWLGVGAFFSVQNYLIETRIEGLDATFVDAIVNMLPNTVVWAALATPVLRLAEIFRVDRTNWKWMLPIQALLGVAVGLLNSLLAVTLFVWLVGFCGHDLVWAKTLVRHLILFFDWNLVIYAAIVGIGSAASFQRESLERKTRALRLEAQLAQSQLQALQAQLHPHFLFNSINGIAELIHEDPATAERMLVKLAELLRSLLDARSPMATLRDDLEFLRKYLDLEKMRFQDRLSIKICIDEAATDAVVPSLLLQPLVENALRHGFDPKTGERNVLIGAAMQNGRLRLAVSDRGPGFGVEDRDFAKGMGLSNTASRLEQLYGKDASLELVEASGGGARAVVTMPATCSERPSR